MTPSPSISQRLERQSLVVMESTIPAAMTVEEWRRRRSDRGRRAQRRSARLAGTRRLVPLRPARCDHLHDTTTRYDPAGKRLTFLQICHACGIEKVVETIPYEPRPKPHAAEGATVHELPVRRDSQPGLRAA
jgi:hypothetical protein